MLSDHLTQGLTLDECILTPYRCSWVTTPVEERRTEECQARADHGWSVVKPTARGLFTSRDAFCFLVVVQLPSSFNSIIMHGCSASRNFMIKRGAFQPHFDTLTISSIIID